MSKEFKEVSANDFLTFSRETPPHVEIEGHVIEIGGGGKAGIDYKMKVLKNAGWRFHALTSFGAHADVAAEAFNNIRRALQETEDQEQLLETLSAMTASAEEGD